MKKLFDKCKRYGKKYSVALMDIVMSYVLWLFWMKFFPISTITPDSGVPLRIVGLVFSFLVVAYIRFSGV